MGASASMSVTTSTMAGRSALSARWIAGASSPGFSTRMPRAPISSATRAKFVHPSHPHSRVPGVYDDDRVVRNVLRELAAHALGPDRNGVGGELRVVFRVPLFADRARLLDPGLSPHGGLRVGVLEHFRE